MAGPDGIDSSSAPDAEAPRSTVVFVGFSADQVDAVRAFLPAGSAATLLDLAQFEVADVADLAATTLGCIVPWVTADARIRPALAAKRILWSLHGVGLCLVGDQHEPHLGALVAELGADAQVAALSDGKSIGTLVGRWMRRERRHVSMVQPLLRQIESTFASRDYEKSRQLIDALVLIDSRKQIFLAMLGLLMSEAGRTAEAVECLERVLIHWPKHAKALALLCTVKVETKAKDALCHGKALVESFGLTLSEALGDGSPPLPTDKILDDAPETKRLFSALHGLEVNVSFAKSYIRALERSGSGSSDLSVFLGILQQSGSPGLVAGLGRLLPGPSSPSPAAPTVPAAPPPTTRGATSKPIRLEPLKSPPPDRQTSDAALFANFAKVREVEPDFVTKNADGGEVVYKLRAFVFHAEANGHRRLGKVLSGIGCDITEGHHELAVALDRIRSVKVDVLVLWYQEGHEQVFEVLREIVESRDLYRMSIWVLVPSQAAQIHFITRAQDLFFDAVDTVRWQRGQFEEDFKRMLGKAKAPESLASILHALRRSWFEPGTAPPLKEEITNMMARAEPSFAANQQRSYWLKAEVALHDLQRGEVASATATMTSMQSALLNSFDAKLILACIKAKQVDPDQAFGPLLDEVLAKGAAHGPGRILRLARILFEFVATASLSRLMNAILANTDSHSVHQFQTAAALYYMAGKQYKEAQAHLAKAFELAPLRVDYIVDFAGTFDKKMVTRSADLWEIAEKSRIWSSWYCSFRAGEVLMRAGNVARARFALEAACKAKPEATEPRRLLEELQSLPEA